MAARGKYKPDSGRLEGEKRITSSPRYRARWQSPPEHEDICRVSASRPRKAGCTFPHSGLMAVGFPFSLATGLMHHVLTGGRVWGSWTRHLTSQGLPSQLMADRRPLRNFKHLPQDMLDIQISAKQETCLWQDTASGLSPTRYTVVLPARGSNSCFHVPPKMLWDAWAWPSLSPHPGPSQVGGQHRRRGREGP